MKTSKDRAAYLLSIAGRKGLAYYQNLTLNNKWGNAEKWLRLSEQRSPIYKWNSGGLKVRRCSQG